MPIYEYQCLNCGHQFEQLQKISEKALKICPQCGKTTLQKLVSNTSFQLKGSGWYVTDFKEKQPKKADPPLNPKSKETKKPADA